MRRTRNAVRALLASLVALIVVFVALVAESQPSGRAEAPSEVLEASEGYIVTAADMQLPELPTGCEATAIATLLRLNGVDASKTDVADAMPKSDTDFVHSFLGDPYSENGGCCMAPCAVETMREFLIGRSLIGYETEGYDLADLPMPCVVWVTIDLAEPQGPLKAQGAYEMFYPSHCVTVLGINDDTVRTIDPLKGYAEYPRDKFEHVYSAVGKQAVYVGKE